MGEHEVAHGERGRHVPAAGVQVDEHVKHPQLWLAARGVVAVQQLQSPPEVAPLDCPLQHCQESLPSACDMHKASSRLFWSTSPQVVITQATDV